MPNRVNWEPSFNLGHELVDAQHQELLAQCRILADYCLATDEASDNAFKLAYEKLMAMAQAHFATETDLLAASNYPELEDYRCECEEFDYLAAEIVTTENFDKLELQRFLTLWWVGHILGAAKQQSLWLKPPAA